MSFLSVSFEEAKINDNKGFVVLLFRYKDHLNNLVLAEHIKFDVIVTGKFHEITFLSKGQRTEKDPFVLINRGQRLIDDILNKELV